MKKISNNKYYKLYAVYDKVAEEVLLNYSGYFKTDGQFVRFILRSVMQTYPLPDVIPVELLSVDGTKMREFAWSCYKQTETVADNLAPLGITPEQAKEMLKRKASEEENTEKKENEEK